MNKWNGKRFSIYDKEEKQVLGLLNKLGEQTNYNTDEVERLTISDNKKVSHEEMKSKYKIDENADFTGSWFGIKRPTQSNEGLASTVEQIIDETIPNINSQLEQITYNIYSFKNNEDGDDWTNAIQKAFDKLYEIGGGSILFPKGVYNVTKPILVKSVATVGGYDQPLIKIIGDGNSNTIIRKTNDTVYNTLNSTFILIKGLTMNIDESWSGIELKNIKIENLYNGDNVYALYGKKGSRLKLSYSSFKTLKENESYSFYSDDIWSCNFKDCFFEGSYGFYNNNGTSLVMENLCANTSKVSYKVGSVYTTLINVFSEGSTGILFWFKEADVTCTSLGAESPNSSTHILSENSNVIVNYYYGNQPTSDTGTIFDIKNGNNIVFEMLRLQMQTTNVGYLWKALTSNNLIVKNMILGGSGRFKYKDTSDTIGNNTYIQICSYSQPRGENLYNLSDQGSKTDWYLSTPSNTSNGVIMGLKNPTTLNNGIDIGDKYTGATPNNVYINSDFSNLKVLGWVREKHTGGQLKNATFKYIPLILSGWAEERPSSPIEGMMFYDKYLKKPIWWDGSKWIYSDGTSV